MREMSDYVLAGRRMSTLTSALSASSSSSSGWTMLALYWRRFNFWGAMASIVAGTVVVSIWQVSSGGPWGMFDMAVATAPGFVAAGLAAFVATLLTSPPSAEITAQFDRVNADGLAA